MLFRRPSSLPISARVVAVKPFRAKHLAAADKIDATRGFSQSALRADAPFSSLGLRAVTDACSVVVVIMGSFAYRPAGVRWGKFAGILHLLSRGGRLRSTGRSSQARSAGRYAFPPFFCELLGFSSFPGGFARFRQYGIPAFSVQPSSP